MLCTSPVLPVDADILLPKAGSRQRRGEARELLNILHMPTGRKWKQQLG